MQNVILILVLAAIITLAARYVYKSKKTGRKCIGCPNSGHCGQADADCSACSSCSTKR